VSVLTTILRDRDFDRESGKAFLMRKNPFTLNSNERAIDGNVLFVRIGNTHA